MSNNGFVSFDEFVSNKVWCDDLSAHFGDWVFENSSNRGYIYANCYWIVLENYGDYWVQLGRYDKLSPDLPMLERWLWDELANKELNYQEGIA
jgi:hypothetical protein